MTQSKVNKSTKHHHSLESDSGSDRVKRNDTGMRVYVLLFVCMCVTKTELLKSPYKS